MANFYLFIFISICIVIICWSIIRLERIYQFPFFMVSVFLSFILPQAIADSLGMKTKPLCTESAEV
jgi:hypothetical protein